MISSFRHQNILITGGSGFIGSHLCEKLLALENQLTLLTLKNDPLINLAGIKDKIKIIPADLANHSELKNIVKQVKPQYIFHLAANTNRIRNLEILPQMINSNLLPIANFIQILSEIPVTRFIVLGTSDIYGHNDSPCHENMFPDPNSPYALTKEASLLFARYAYNNHTIPTVMLIPFMVYGPRQGLHMLISQAIISCLKGEDFKMTPGEQVREYNYVDDIVEGIIGAAVAPDVVGEIINLCGAERKTVYEVVREITGLMGNPVKILRGAFPYRDQEIMRHFGDNAKALKLLDYQTKTSLTTGLENTIAYFKAHFSLS